MVIIELSFEGGFFMKKIRVVLMAISIIWMIVAFKMLTDGNESVVEAFKQEEQTYENVRINAVGNYGNLYLNQNTKKNILIDMANEIGINRYGISIARDNDVEETVLSQTGKNGNVMCKITTTEEHTMSQAIRANQEIEVTIELKKQVDAVRDYQRVINKIFDKYGIKPTMSVLYYND